MADKKMTQEALASAVGYKSQGAIGNAIARGSLPKKLREVAAVLGVRIEWIETGSLPKGADEPSPLQYEAELTLSELERDIIHALRVLPIDEQQEIANDVMHRAERLNQAVERLLAERGLAIAGFLSASRAAETLPAPPQENANPASRQSLRKVQEAGVQPTMPMARRTK